MINHFVLHDGVKVHYYNVKKFKTISIKVSFRDYLVKEDYMIRTVLASMLSKSNAKFPEERLFSKHLKGLYGTKFSCYFSSKGINETFNISISIVNHKYITENIDLLEKAFELVNDVLNKPDLSIDKYNLEVDLMKQEIFGNITKRQQAYKEFRKLMYDLNDEYYSYDRGEKINSITYDDVINYYQKIIKRNCEIFIVGDVDETDIINAYKNFSFYQKYPTINIVDVFHHIEVDQQTIIEESNIAQQSHLCIGYRTNVLPHAQNIKERYALTILAYMLGGDMFSTLFQEIREKRSLAYTVSLREDISRTLFLYTAIDKEKYEEALGVIDQIITDYIKGNVEPHILELSKKALNTGTISSYDQVSYYMDVLESVANGQNTLELEERIKIASEITMNEISDVAKKIKLSTIYFLKGELS